MTVRHLKRAAPRPSSENADLRDAVMIMLTNIAMKGEAEVRRYAEGLDGWTGPVGLSDEDRRAAIARVPDDLKNHIRFAHTNIRRFADAQRATLTDCEIELLPGHWAGQKSIPVSSAGCYVPGGRYAHIASALMTITTAKAAGVPHIAAVSPPRGGRGIPDPIVYAMDLAGADQILVLGGVQAIASLAHGLFGLRPADIIVGPGNAYVAEAKRQLFGQVGIDMFAGPTDSLVIADSSAQPETVAWDLVGQAEHGPDSPVWLVTDCETLAAQVIDLAPRLAGSLPDPNRAAALAAWEALAEIVLCDTRDEMAETADRYAPEHLHVQARDLPWWLGRLRVYGSLFLGAETTVPFGDKVAGPNHVLPTSGAARYTGGLSVHKFLKTVTWQRCDAPAAARLAAVAAAICREEGMEGHARSADLRLTAKTEADLGLGPDGRAQT